MPLERIRIGYSAFPRLQLSNPQPMRADRSCAFYWMDIQLRCSEKNPFSGLKIVFHPSKKILFASEKTIFMPRKTIFHLAVAMGRTAKGSRGKESHG